MDHDKHSSTESFGEDKKKYAKLTPELKHIFIRKIVMDNLSIRQASELLRINYSSAKAIISEHRKSKLAHRKPANRKNVPYCGFRALQQEDCCVPVQEVCSSVGGLLMSTLACPNKRKIIKKVTVLSMPPTCTTSFT